MKPVTEEWEWLLLAAKSRARAARPSGHEDRLLEAGPDAQVVAQRYLGETLAPRLEDPEEAAGGLGTDDHITRVSDEGGRRRHVRIARFVVVDVEARNGTESCPSAARELRDRGDGIRTQREGRDRSRPPAGVQRDDRAAVRASVDGQERVPADRTEPTWCDPELIGAPRPGVASDPLHMAESVDRVHHAPGRLEAARAPGRREEPGDEAGHAVECPGP